MSRQHILIFNRKNRRIIKEFILSKHKIKSVWSDTLSLSSRSPTQLIPPPPLQFVSFHPNSLSFSNRMFQYEKKSEYLYSLCIPFPHCFTHFSLSPLSLFLFLSLSITMCTWNLILTTIIMKMRRHTYSSTQWNLTYEHKKKDSKGSIDCIERIGLSRFKLSTSGRR